jgi:pSer/pThr/pTyr-binding forkhead associated (FHA) protein
MSQNKTPEEKKSFSVDWLVRGSLTRIGDIFDKLTGRKWKPSSSLATSELIEKLKKLLDAEARVSDKKVKFVPHNIKLKMQWDKFSTDAEDAMKKLEYELLTAVIDHINDKRYHTHAPLKFEIKPDYFTEGVKLLASFGKFDDEENDVEMNVTMTNLKNIVIPPLDESAVKVIEEKEIFVADFTVAGKPKRVELAFSGGERLSVGRTKENALSIDDTSVSKAHAALVLNAEKQLMVADTGSTNGTFINGKRIAYGKAFPVASGDKVKFGTIEVAITYIPREVEEEVLEAAPITTSAIETERMLTEEEYLKKQNVTVAEEIPLAETASEEKQTALPTVAISKEEIPVEETKAESAEPLTGQRIVLDFGENK